MAKKSTKRASGKSFVPCVPKRLPEELQVDAAAMAVRYNPANAPAIPMFSFVSLDKGRLAVMTQKYWGPDGVKLTVAFPFDRTPVAVQNKILAYANKWSERANISFVLSSVDPDVRIAREADGYWSYLGTDIRMIPPNEPTMNLQGFTERTPEAEYNRVVTHEFGHTCGMPHEHMRKEIIDKLDRRKTIAWGRQALGWDERTVIQQILTPLSEQSIMGTPNADETSIMCYQLPASITKDGRPIRGGDTITENDANFASQIYPKAITPPDPPDPPKPPVAGEWAITAQGERKIVLELAEVVELGPLHDECEDESV